MISQLPKWVEYGAFILAFIAGSVNAIGLLGFEHQAISHLSGTATLLGTELFHTSFNTVFHLLGILMSFMLGAALSGVLLSSSSLKLGRHYDSLLVIEGVLLLVSVYYLNNGSVIGHYLASAACGLQNALATTYSGAIVRTTHVTGIFTDLGIMLGGMLRGAGLDKRKLILFLLIVSGFIAGGTFGALIYNMFGFYALTIPAVICFCLAFIYRTFSTKMAQAT